ncbi:hypothetical protein T484DRAFT_1777980 [Baffinella frigidus]|nr:hypothetical protein T484DRAFT_1777980 [Cryptophyta sp. CCMP2293]
MLKGGKQSSPISSPTCEGREAVVSYLLANMRYEDALTIGNRAESDAIALEKKAEDDESASQLAKSLIEPLGKIARADNDTALSLIEPLGKIARADQRHRTGGFLAMAKSLIEPLGKIARADNDTALAAEMEAEKLRGKATAHARSNIPFRVAEMELEPAEEKAEIERLNSITEEDAFTQTRRRDRAEIERLNSIKEEDEFNARRSSG